VKDIIKRVTGIPETKALRKTGHPLKKLANPITTDPKASIK
jgi:hypothetical protein